MRWETVGEDESGNVMTPGPDDSDDSEDVVCDKIHVMMASMMTETTRMRMAVVVVVAGAVVCDAASVVVAHLTTAAAAAGKKRVSWHRMWRICWQEVWG